MHSKFNLHRLTSHSNNKKKYVDCFLILIANFPYWCFNFFIFLSCELYSPQLFLAYCRNLLLISGVVQILMPPLRQIGYTFGQKRYFKKTIYNKYKKNRNFSAEVFKYMDIMHDKYIILYLHTVFNLHFIMNLKIYS